MKSNKHAKSFRCVAAPKCTFSSWVLSGLHKHEYSCPWVKEQRAWIAAKVKALRKKGVPIFGQRVELKIAHERQRGVPQDGSHATPKVCINMGCSVNRVNRHGLDDFL